MTAEELRLSAVSLFGEGPGWQSRTAEALGIDRSRISRMLAGQVPVPGPVCAAIRAWRRAGYDARDSAI